MEPRRKNQVRFQRPKIRRVYVRLTNPDNPKREMINFTAYETDIDELKKRIMGQAASAAS